MRRGETPYPEACTKLTNPPGAFTPSILDIPDLILAEFIVDCGEHVSQSRELSHQPTELGETLNAHCFKIPNFFVKSNRIAASI